MHDSDRLVSRHQQERNVHAWMRAAAYAAGTEPEDEFGTTAESNCDPAPLEAAGAANQCDNLALGAALLSISFIGRGELIQV